MKRLMVLVLALAVTGCAASFALFDSEDKTADHVGLALTALRSTCTLSECENMLVAVGMDDKEARKSCALAWLADASPCKGGDE